MAQAKFDNPIPLISPIQGNAQLAEGFQLQSGIDTTNVQQNLDAIINTRLIQKQQQKANYEKRMLDVMADLDTSAITDPEALAYVDKSKQGLTDFIKSEEGAAAFSDPINNKELFMKYQQLQGNFNRDLEIAKQTTALDKTFLGVLGSNKGDAEVNRTQYDKWKKLPYDQRRNTPLIPYDRFGANFSDADLKGVKEALLSKFQTKSEALENDKGTNLVTTSKIIYYDDAMKALQGLNGGDLIDRYKYVSKEKFPTLEDYTQSQMASLLIATNLKQEPNGRKYYELIDDAKLAKNDQYQTESELKKQQQENASKEKIAKTAANADIVVAKERTKQVGNETKGKVQVANINAAAKGKKPSNEADESNSFSGTSYPILILDKNGAATIKPFDSKDAGFNGSMTMDEYEKLYKGIGGDVNLMIEFGLIPKEDIPNMKEIDVIYEDGEAIGIKYGKGRTKVEGKTGKVNNGKSIRFDQLKKELLRRTPKAGITNIENNTSTE